MTIINVSSPPKPALNDTHEDTLKLSTAALSEHNLKGNNKVIVYVYASKSIIDKT